MYQVGDLVENDESVTVIRNKQQLVLPTGTTLRITGVQGHVLQVVCHYNEFGTLYFRDDLVSPALITCW